MAILLLFWLRNLGPGALHALGLSDTSQFAPFFTCTFLHLPARGAGDAAPAFGADPWQGTGGHDVAQQFGHLFPCQSDDRPRPFTGVPQRAGTALR